MSKWFMAFVSMLLLTPSMAFAQDASAADAGVFAVDAGAALAAEGTGLVETGVAVAGGVPPEGFDLIPALVSAAQGGQWSLFAAMLIMLLVWAVTKAPIVSGLITGEAKVWVAAVAGTLLAVSVAIFTTQPNTVEEWLSCVFSGLMVGLAATGMWELITRKTKGKPIDADGDGILDA